MLLSRFLKQEKLVRLHLSPAVAVETGTRLGESIARMQTARSGCLIIRHGLDIVGIFTERDVLTKVVEMGVEMKTPIETLMTRDPKVLTPEHSVADAIRLMHKGGYRHVPIVAAQGQLAGVCSVRNIVNYLAEHFPHGVYNLPPDLHQVNRAREGA